MTEHCHHLAYEPYFSGDRRFVLPGARPHYAPDRSFDATHIRLDLDLDIRGCALAGTCETTLRAFHDGAREVAFDAVQMRIRSVEAQGRRCRFRYDGRKLSIRLPRAVKAGESAVVAIRYRVKEPPLGLHFVAPGPDDRTAPVQVWTQGQDEYSRYWFPCHDAPQEKATTELLVTVPAGFVAVSNGRLAAVRPARGRRRTYHFRQSVPHSTYLVSLAVGRFVEIADSWDGIPITYYTERGKEALARNAFGDTPRMVAFFSEATGVRYPYEKYAQVAAAHFIFGGMENTSATTQTDQALHDDRAHAEAFHEGLVAHELAHQWWGDLLTCRDWSHAWLNESFATYAEALWMEHAHGRDEMRYLLMQNARTYLVEDSERYRHPIVTNVYKDPSDVFDRHLYQKGACVLHMLRDVLGDDLFWRALRAYVAEHAGGSVETSHLQESIARATGKNLGWFFDQWIYKAGHPEYRVVYGWDARRSSVTAWVGQVHRRSADTPLFRMPVTFAIELPDGQRLSFRETVADREHEFRFRVPAEPVDFRFDAQGVILKKLETLKPPAMWRRQLFRDPDPVGRIEAASELARVGSRDDVEALERAFSRERFWGARAEIARALGRSKGDAAFRILRRSAAERHVKVRRAVIEALGEQGRPEAFPALTRALAARDSYLVPAEACRAIGKLRPPQAVPLLRGQLSKPSWNHSIACGAVDGLAALATDRALDLLEEQTREGHPMQVRIAAIRALGAAGRGRPGLPERLEPLLRDRALRVQHATLVALGKLGDPRAIPALAAFAAREHIDGRSRRAADEAVRSIRAGVEEEDGRRA